MEKVWSRHLVFEETLERPGLLYVDLHLLNEVTSPQAFAMLEARGAPIARPDRALATLDHATPTLPPTVEGKRAYLGRSAELQCQTLERNALAAGIRFFGWEDERRGIAHVVAPELGLTLPGMTIVCGDSHTSTHGAFGCVAFGIGTTEVAEVLATQCIMIRRPKTMRVNCVGTLPPGVTAKDLALAIIARIGAGGAAGHAIEYAGPVVTALSMDERMTLCNMSIECGARAGMIGPDSTTIAWLRSRPEAPADFDARVADWLALASDEEAEFDREITIDAAELEPMVTWGTTPDTGVAITARVPKMRHEGDAQGCDYMGFVPEQPLAGTPVDFVFIGSCTNGRLSDLRAAAGILAGRRISPRVRLLVVPGSETVRRAAEAEGLHRVFIEAGGEWRLSGCSMCLGMNGDIAPAGKTVVATSNRNFKGRQGRGSRTILASPATAAASAVGGKLCDPREVPFVSA